MTDANPLLLKLYFVYTIQRKGIEHLLTTLLKRGEYALLDFNTQYVMSLLTKDQRDNWAEWVKDLTSDITIDRIENLDRIYGVIADNQSPTSTHLEEFIPKTKTVLQI